MATLFGLLPPNKSLESVKSATVSAKWPALLSQIAY